jgi:DsbC/DsbD-like thiol-disulfide interchange protein/cytochrome c biogenesis protein CcdA
VEKTEHTGPIAANPGGLKKLLSYMKPQWHDARMNAMVPFPLLPGSVVERVRAFFSFFFIEWPLCPLIAIFAALMSLPAYAQLPGAALNVPASLEAETSTPAPGQSVTVAFHFKPKPTWHGYWENPGDAGFGMTLDWTLPKGVTAGKPRYPVPEPLIISGLMNHVFEHDYAVLVDLTLDSGIASGTALPVKVRADWLACTDEICVPEGGDLAIDLVAGDGMIGNDRSRFDVWRATLPIPMDRNARYAITGNRIEIAIPIARGAALDRPYFFAQTEKLFRYAAPQSARRTGDWLVVSGEVGMAFDGRIDGLLRFGDAQGLEVRAMPGAVPTGGDVVTVLGQGEPPLRRGPFGGTQGRLGVTFGWILGFSVLGGLLLNLMPCVFPILGLKALSLAKMGGDERDARRDALAYSSGVILSCLALGGILLGLRAGGEEIGWAFQLQEPVIVLLLLLLMVAVTANLAGLFEVGSVGVGDSLTRTGGLAGSFWTGVLAAMVATPCTGPFMAAAMGAALLLPVAQALLLFAGLGFGLALPFLVIAYVPAARRMLPKPGLWLGTFRKAMAVPMGLTALALLWLLWRLSGLAGLMVGIAASAVILRQLFQWGMARHTVRDKTMTIAFVAAVAIAALLILPAMPRATTQAAALPGDEFSETRLAKLRAEGKPLFVYFTADWCVTCKINEAAAINREDTKAAFAKAGVVTLKGDFTRRDPAIARFLSQHGRSGVPLYLYYPVGGEVQILPQILTGDTLQNLAK